MNNEWGNKKIARLRKLWCSFIFEEKHQYLKTAILLLIMVEKGLRNDEKRLRRTYALSPVNLTSDSRLCYILSDSLLPWQLPLSAMTIHPLMLWQFIPHYHDVLHLNILTFYLLLAWHYTPFSNDRLYFCKIALISMTIFRHLLRLVIICARKVEKRQPSAMYPSIIHSKSLKLSIANAFQMLH